MTSTLQVEPQAQDAPPLHCVFFSKHLPFFTHDRNSFFLKLVLPSGYPYFEWNDRLYKVEGQRYVETDYLVDAKVTASTARIYRATEPVTATQ